MLVRWFVPFVLAPSVLLAQDSSDVKPTRSDVSMPLTVGVTTGSMSFADHRIQQGVTGVVRYHYGQSLSIGVSPTYARMAYPTSLGGGAVSGLTDLPIELGLDHAFNDAWLSPTIGLALGTTIPVGDQQIGFGSGTMGATVGAGIGFSPDDRASVHLGAGKSLTAYSMFGALGGSEAAWGDAEVSYHVLERLEATLGYDGDFSSSDTLGTPRAVALSFAAALGSGYTLTVSGGHGVSGPAARWTFALGIGTDFAGFQAIGSSSPIQRLMRAVGGSSNRGHGSVNSGHGKVP